MYYELYIDIFFIENFMMDSILLLLVFRVMGRKAFTIRTFLAGAIGAGLSCVVVAIRMMPVFKYISLYLSIPLVMVVIGMKEKGIVQLAEALTLLYFFAICMAGAAQLIRPYIRSGSVLYVTAVAGYWLCRTMWDLLTRYRQIQKQCCQVTLYEEGKKWVIQALIDTGNLLLDSPEQKPVQIISRKLAEEIYGSQSVEELFAYSLSKENEQRWTAKKIHYLPCRTIQGTSLMPVVTMERLEVECGSVMEIERPRIGISIEELSEFQDYRMIVNAQSIGGSKHGCRDNEHTTISDKRNF